MQLLQNGVSPETSNVFVSRHICEPFTSQNGSKRFVVVVFGQIAVLPDGTESVK